MSDNIGFRFAVPALVFRNQHYAWFARLIEPQPKDAQPPASHYRECHYYFARRPEMGWAYYWTGAGCWNSTKPFHPPYEVGQRVWHRGTLHWYRIAGIKPTLAHETWWWTFILEKEQ